MSELVTGEAVALDLRTAALPSRALAGLLDALLQLALLFALAVAVGAAGAANEAAGAAVAVVVFVVVLIGYPVAFETALRGRTPGKAALGLRVVRDDGGPIGFRQAFVRGLAGAFLERPGITLFFGAVVTMLLNPRNKRIGDLLAGTVVLQERVAVRGGQVAQMPPPLAGWAAGLDLSGLPDDLALSARQFVGRSAELTVSAREDLGGRLVAEVRASTSPAPPEGTPGWAFLAAVLAERRRREELRLAASPGSGGWGAGHEQPAYVEPLPARQAVPPAAPPGPGGFVAPG